jgi:hypothetical protein
MRDTEWGWEAEQWVRLAALRSTLDAPRVPMEGMRSHLANGVGAARRA